MVKPFATLSGNGWLTEPGEIADKMMSYFFLSDASQSQVFAGNVASLPSIIQRYGNNTEQIVTETERQLEDMFNRQFDGCSVEADVDTTGETDNRMNLRIVVTFQADGESYNLARLVTTLDSAILKIAEINNNANT